MTNGTYYAAIVPQEGIREYFVGEWRTPSSLVPPADNVKDDWRSGSALQQAIMARLAKEGLI